jgi:hypothetical protein
MVLILHGHNLIPTQNFSVHFADLYAKQNPVDERCQQLTTRELMKVNATILQNRFRCLYHHYDQ